MRVCRCLWAALGGLAVLLSSCGSEASDAGLPPDPEQLLAYTEAPSEAQAFEDLRVAVSLQQVDVEQCMTASGFEYLPLPLPDPPTVVDHSSESFISSNGFGLITLSLPSAQDLGEEPLNPNLEHRESLSTDERNAWDEQRFECQSAAEEAHPPASTNLVVLSDASAQFVNDVSSQVLMSEQYQNALSGWRSCMNEVGYEFDSYEDMVSAVHQGAGPYIDAVNDKVAEVLGSGGTESDLQALTWPDVLPPELQGALQTSISEEVAIARATNTCDAGLVELNGQLTNELILEYLQNE